MHCFGLDKELGEDIEAVVEEEEELDFLCLWQVLPVYFAFTFAFAFYLMSIAQGDFEDPEFCMRYYHCNKDLRVSLNFHQKKEFL